MQDSPKLLVVDDSRTSRLKLVAAAEALGYRARSVESGAEALDAFGAESFDLILLDLEMPGIDGYEVLSRLKADPARREIPVLVISGVESTTDIARAIELGAEDVLPKSFDKVIFRARIGASLERWRLRQAERLYLAEVDRLSDASRIVERAHFDPSKLGIQDIARRDDDLAGFARVFLDLADLTYVREATYRRRISLLIGGLLLILFGAVKGVQPSLSRVLAKTEIDPIALAPWTLASGAVLACLACLVIGQSPNFARARLIPLGIYAILACALPRLLVLEAAVEMPAMIIAGLLATEAMIVFAMAALLGQESPRATRLLGLVLGLAGVAVILATDRLTPLSFSTASIAMILLATLGYALGKIIVAQEDQSGSDAPLADVAVILVVATLVAFAVSALYGPADLVPPMGRDVVLLVAGLGAVGFACHVIMIVTVRITGPVFASQSAYTATGAGILWSVLILEEPMSLWIGVALALLLVGSILVMPRDREEDLDALFARDPELDAARLRLGL